MQYTLFSAVISGVFSLIGIIIANYSNRSAMDSKLDKQQAIINTKLETLTEEVKKHNNFAERIPKIELRLDYIENELKER